jgi:PEP-CTERM motif
MRMKHIGPLVLLALAFAPSAFADPVTYATWAAYGGGGTESGTIGSVNVTYSGEVSFIHQSGVGNYNYFLPLTTYTSPLVPNAPTDGGLIAIVGNGTTTNTFTFSTPVTGLILSEVSLGGFTNTSYTFNDDFTILSCGPNIVYGGGCIHESGGNTMFAMEGDGTILFDGTISSLSFTTANGEYWNGFTIGLSPNTSTGPVGPTPEPGTLVLFGTGILGLAGAVRRKLFS